MSLATTAATWTLDDIPPQVASKKRQSTVRTATEMIGVSGSAAFDSELNLPKLTAERQQTANGRQPIANGRQPTAERQPTANGIDSMREMQENNDGRKVKVNQLLDKLTSNGATEGLVDYVPPNSMKHNTHKDMYLPKAEPVQLYKIPMIDRKHGDYAPTGVSASNSSSYGSAYINTTTPPSSANRVKDDKLLEKINYMIHLLEEQKMEKTNYVMEEFVLYTMLGVFVIYVVDSFSRSAKYIR
jgi:hypothetical protein